MRADEGERVCLVRESQRNSEETVKKWKKENPDKVKEQKKRYRMKNAKANYEKVKTWRREHLEQRRRQKERERCSKRFKSKEEDLPIINFDCDEAIASEQQHQDLEDLNELITSELFMLGCLMRCIILWAIRLRLARRSRKIQFKIKNLSNLRPNTIYKQGVCVLTKGRECVL